MGYTGHVHTMNVVPYTVHLMVSVVYCENSETKTTGLETPKLFAQLTTSDILMGFLTLRATPFTLKEDI